MSKVLWLIWGGLALLGWWIFSTFAPFDIFTGAFVVVSLIILTVATGVILSEGRGQSQ